ncbi:MAG: CRISPR system precrRNA processing endoribonuclease RAMP protein Cas6 [Bryobacteraceae bacterium]
MATTFEFFRFRFHFRALGPVHFPKGKAGNAIRGALGLALRQSASPAVFTGLFQPEGGPGRTPSGLADPPRPFVIRAAHLDGLDAAVGSTFFWDVHAFDLANPPLVPLRQAFERLAEEGLGPGRGRAALERVEQLDLLDRGRPVDTPDPPLPPLSIDLDAAAPVATVRLRFVTPTELKGDGGLVERPDFAILFGRLRDRIASLSALYGRGPLAIDFRGLGERAREVRLVRCVLEWQQAERRSGRTGQVHSIGGFTGDAEYAGNLGEFLPWLAAARWVGVGRHTVWGKGDVRVVSDLRG